ncbi:hypothetical protein C8Q70DRAFT_1046079 [Cubamyces menziesii]|uniref:Uncharacterized protein n=1 Tax=Trametes cubensis TaxID=1111947 RepID=A0AAD7XET4_9APHY|nr:hypothetical protein C8Q70DRAFT_1046079 [Cubamyces menziesii]KAJ8490129.1 hypothetical protein ONZ51_g2513 [Trametes cubensis]
MTSLASNAEFISSIVSFAYWGENRPGVPLSLRTVLALALTCRTFLEPALDQLWRRQLTLFNLAKTLPENSWEEVAEGEPGPDGRIRKWIKVTRVLLARDWTRFDYYAAKIKELGYDPRAPYGSVEITTIGWRKEVAMPGVFTNLCTVRLPYELVPNVKRLRWTTEESNVWIRPYVYIFLNPPLTSLVLDFHDAELDTNEDYSDATFIKYTLLAVVEQCPAFRDVEVLWPQMDRYADAVAGFLRAMPKLRSFVVNVREWTESMLVDLASLRGLRRTRVFLERADFPWLASAAVQPPFPALEDLILDAPTLDNCTAFLVALRSLKLRALTVNCDKRPSATALNRFLSTLSVCSPPGTLRALSIFDGGQAESVPLDAPTDGAVHTATLLPLASFTNLCVLTIDLSAPLALDNTFPSTVLSSLPALEELSLGATHGWGQRPALTFTGLAQIVALCPLLEQLRIAIDTSHLQQLWTSEDVGAGLALKENTRLRTIDLIDSYVIERSSFSATAATLSRNLATLFPDLERIKAKSPGWKTKKDSVKAKGEGTGDGEGGDEAESPPDASDAPPSMDVQAGLASDGFWREVEKQVATFALLRDMDFPMDLS